MQLHCFPMTTLLRQPWRAAAPVTRGGPRPTGDSWFPLEPRRAPALRTLDPATFRGLSRSTLTRPVGLLTHYRFQIESPAP